MRDPHTIIIEALITEKSTFQTESQNAYVFKVAKDTNRIQVKAAIEEIFDVKVRKVNTINQSGKRRRVGRSMGFTSGFKKAVVTLEPGYEIDLL
ncbi:MAG: 50S ribosomal protein L23 [Planctomycetota bacterium]|nr:MAG: 50S ribosomal protein L23 [Planctomycetota bacterium]HIC24090.1 50S ribosomal protein L23 [Planctomycetota bacterium]